MLHPSRKPFRADLIVFWSCVLMVVWYMGFLYGHSKVPIATAPVCKKISVQDMSKVQMKRWANYWSRREL